MGFRQYIPAVLLFALTLSQPVLTESGEDIVGEDLVGEELVEEEVSLDSVLDSAEAKTEVAPAQVEPMLSIGNGTPSDAGAITSRIEEKPEPEFEQLASQKEESLIDDLLSEEKPENATAVIPPESVKAVAEASLNPLELEKDFDLPPLNDAMFRVREYEGDIELLTPWGNFVIPGEFGKRFGESDFRFAINVRDLIPEKVEKEEEPSEEEVTESKEPLVADGTTDSEKGDRGLANQSPMPTPLVKIDDTDKLIVEANRLYNRRRFFEALSVVESILQKKPEYTRAWLMRGSLMLVQGHKDLALKSWEQALKIDPQDQEVRAVVDKYK